MNIERPDFGPLQRTMRFEFTSKEQRAVNHFDVDDTPVESDLLAKSEYARGHGTTLHVERKVSRMLELTDIDPVSLVHVSPLSQYMLFKWQDDSLPSLFLEWPTADSDRFVHDTIRGPVIALLAISDLPSCSEASAARWATSEFIASDISSFVTGSYELPRFDLDRPHTEGLRYLVLLAIKTLAYASIPQFAPIPLRSRSSIKSVGLHPKHLHGPVSSIQYLPRVVREQSDARSLSGSSDARAFLGRMGHMRLYKAERYVHMRGQWQFIPPIEPPDGAVISYRIRQPRGLPSPTAVPSPTPHNEAAHR